MDPRLQLGELRSSFVLYPRVIVDNNNIILYLKKAERKDFEYFHHKEMINV
jgi:hypothetical protein